MNWADYVILAIVAFSCVAGLMRGLLREVISLLTWVLAVFFAWRFADLLEPHLGGVLAGAAVRPWAARTIIFIVVLMLGTAVGAIVGHFVRLSIFSPLDRLLGVLFGLARGGVVIGLLTILCHALRLDAEPWYKTSVIVPAGEKAGEILLTVAGMDSAVAAVRLPVNSGHSEV